MPQKRGRKPTTARPTVRRNRTARSRVAKHPFRISYSAPKRSWTEMHPVMRTMFVSLAIGSVGVFGSMLYFIGVAEATRPILYPDTAPIFSIMDDKDNGGVFSELIHDLREQQGLPRQVEPTTPREYLREQAEESGYDVALLNRIAYCESRWRMVQNTKSTAYGYFQILDGTERLTPQYKAGLRKTDPYVNIDMAIFLYGKYGTIPWTESQACWSR